jgi:hypothetical protein
VSATNTGIGYASESTSIQTDQSVSQSLASGNSFGAGSVAGADLKLAQSSGNTFNLADPTATLAAAGIAQSGLADAFQGLQRITDTSGLAVARALDLAKSVQGGQGQQVTETVTKVSYAVAAALGIGLVAFLLTRKKA